MDPTETLIKLEPVFKQAGELACEMQATAKHHNKFNTGLHVTDIVTEADLAVQEFLLGEIAKTDLINCRLLAEEDTPKAKQFNERGNFYLAIDPIDGTAIYAKGGKQFSVIVSLHDGKNLLYTFKHFPALNWTQKIVGKQYFTAGQEPFFGPNDKKNKIFYYIGSPENILSKIYRQLTSKGLIFENCVDSAEDIDEASVYACGKAAGFYAQDPNVYDGLVSLHVAMAKGFTFYSGGPNGTLDLTNIQKRETGLYYPGYYLALNS